MVSVLALQARNEGSIPSSSTIWRGREVWSSHQPHKLEIAGSNPAPAPKRLIYLTYIIIGVKYTDMRVGI